MPRKLPPSAFDFKAARRARNMSQQKAAALLFATQPSISRWEADGTMPEIYKMAWMLHWQLEDSKNGKTNAKRARRTTGAANSSGKHGGSKKAIRQRSKAIAISESESETRVPGTGKSISE